MTSYLVNHRPTRFGIRRKIRAKDIHNLCFRVIDQPHLELKLRHMAVWQGDAKTIESLADLKVYKPIDAGSELLFVSSDRNFGLYASAVSELPYNLIPESLAAFTAMTTSCAYKSASLAAAGILVATHCVSRAIADSRYANTLKLFLFNGYSAPEQRLFSGQALKEDMTDFPSTEADKHALRQLYENVLLRL